MHCGLSVMVAPRVYLFTSTDYVAAYNERRKQDNSVSAANFRLSPVSCGMQKACVELLLCDYSRKGFIDGRVGRLSAVFGRLGWSNLTQICSKVIVIQFAAVLSGNAESNFELCMKVNLMGAINLVDALRAVGEKL